MNNFGEKENFIWSVADLLRECRTALISGAVTRKIDVKVEV